MPRNHLPRKLPTPNQKHHPQRVRPMLLQRKLQPKSHRPQNREWQMGFPEDQTMTSTTARLTLRHCSNCFKPLRSKNGASKYKTGLCRDCKGKDPNVNATLDEARVKGHHRHVGSLASRQSHVNCRGP
jgi:hypothetical protein